MQMDVQALLVSLRGQKIRLPDLHIILEDFAQAVNPGMERMSEDVNQRLRRSVTFASAAGVPACCAYM